MKHGLMMVAMAASTVPSAELWQQYLPAAQEILARVKQQYPGCDGALNAVTTEPGLRQARSKDITAEDFMDAIDRIAPADMPFQTLSTTEKELITVDTAWNVDSFPGVKGARGRADNEPAPASGSADSGDVTANIRKMGNVAQGFSRTWRRGWIADVPKINGVKNIDAYGKATYTELLKQDTEAAMCSLDQVAVFDQGSGLGAVMAGYRKIVDFANKYAAASAYAVGKPTDIHYAPTAASLTGALTAVHNRAMWKTVSYQLRLAAKQNGDWTLLAGLGLRQAVTDLTNPSQVTATTAVGASAPEQVRVYTRGEQDNVLGQSVDVIQTDFGRIMVAPTDYLGTTTTDATGGALTAVNTASATRALASFVTAPNAGLLIKRGNLFKRWAKLPYTEELGKDGAGMAFDTKQLLTFGVRNPIKAGFLALT